MANTHEPSQQRSEMNQSEYLINPELNEELDGEPLENPKDELHMDLKELRVLSDELNNPREPSRVSLATSLQNIIKSINIAQSEITNLSQYRA